MNVRSYLLLLFLFAYPFSLAARASVASPSLSTNTDIWIAQEMQPEDAKPLPAPTNPPVFQRIDAAIYANCTGAQSSLAEAHLLRAVPTWSAYVHLLMRCGDKQKDLIQARIYGGAIAQIVGSILYLKPDADEAAAWRKTAKQLISKGLPEAKADPELVEHFDLWRDMLP